MSKSSKAYMEAPKHLLSSLAAVNFLIAYKRGGLNLAVYSDEIWGNNPVNDKSTSLYIVMLANDSISFNVGLQSLNVQSIMEAELVAAALTIKKAVFCSIIMVELSFEKGSSGVPLYLDNTSTLHVAGNRTYSPRAKHIALMFFSFKS